MRTFKIKYAGPGNLWSVWEIGGGKPPKKIKGTFSYREAFAFKKGE